MNSKQAHKEAAAISKTEGLQFVVHVPDEGCDVYSAAQALMWMQLVFIEACYVSGVKVACPIGELTKEALATKV